MCLLPPHTLQSQKQMAGCECSSHMSREERKKQSFHLYFAAVTPLRSTSRWCSVIHLNFTIMGIHCGSPLLLARSVIQHNPESECLDAFNTEDLNLMCLQNYILYSQWKIRWPNWTQQSGKTHSQQPNYMYIIYTCIERRWFLRTQKSASSGFLVGNSRNFRHITQ